jgi:hypothetical protein
LWELLRTSQNPFKGGDEDRSSTRVESSERVDYQSAASFLPNRIGNPFWISISSIEL